MPHLPQPARSRSFAATRVVRRASETRPQSRSKIFTGSLQDDHELPVAALISEIKRLTEPREA